MSRSATASVVVPEQLEITDDLPRTAMGKVRKRDLQLRYGVR